MDKKFLQLLACPTCKKAILLKKKRLYCPHCHIWYPIRHGIPVMVDLKHLSSHLRGQIRFFDSRSKRYGTRRAIRTWQEKYMQRYFFYRPTWRKKVFVDDACGPGYMSIEAAKRGAFVVACDLNLSGLVCLKRYVESIGLSDQILFVCCSSEHLPIRTGCADGVVANAILEHLPNEREAIADISRIAKKGAILMVTVPVAYHLVNPLFLLAHYIQDKRIGHLRRYTKEDLLLRFRDWKHLAVYYTGHTQKVIKTVLNLFVPLFDEEGIEEDDERDSQKNLFASNVSIIMNRK